MTITLSFGGSGNFFPFQLGIAQALKALSGIDWSQMEVHSVSGGITGALAMLFSDANEIEAKSQEIIRIAGSKPRLWEIKQHYLDVGAAVFPPAMSRCPEVLARLHLGVTTLPLFQPRILTAPYRDEEYLLRMITYSCGIPAMTSTFGTATDGGFSHHYALHDENTLVFTLNPYEHSTIFWKSAPSLTFMRFPSYDELMELYELGKSRVWNQQTEILGKLRRAQLTSEQVKFQPIARFKFQRE